MGKLNAIPDSRRIIGYFIVLLSYLGLLLVAANAFTRHHTLGFHRPAVGGEIRMSSDCPREAESLVIALSAAPHLFERHDFGLVEAVDSISEDGCAGLPPRNLSTPIIDAIQNRYVWAQKEFIETAPPWYLARYTGNPQSSALFPSPVFGHLYMLSKNYKTLNSGKGILHYMRCDYSLHLEPYQTFWASDLHHGNATDDLFERISECGETVFFEEFISGKLSDFSSAR
ncbi:MAG: hypothetical protein ACRBBS_13215 [Thalassovita sp.]